MSRSGDDLEYLRAVVVTSPRDNVPTLATLSIGPFGLREERSGKIDPHQ
jgi:hypothetical protein